jgi:hypothetical protein
VRISLLLLSLACLPCLAQIPDDAENTGGAPPPRAEPVNPQGPAAQQDAESEREKILKAADQLDLIQNNAETTKVAVDNMKADITRLQAANANLTQQLSDLRAAFDKAEAERTKERQVLVDEVAQLVASRNAEAIHPHHHTAETQPVSDTGADATMADTEVHPSAAPAPAPSPPPDAAPAPAPRRQKGYYHTVESGETLTLICQAFRDQGVNVSVAQVRRANGLTSRSKLRIGQRLFIPQPST